MFFLRIARFSGAFAFSGVHVEPPGVPSKDLILSGVHVDPLESLPLTLSGVHVEPPGVPSIDLTLSGVHVELP